MSGRTIGAALSGFTRGDRDRTDRRDREESRDWRKNRQEKMLDDETYYDPIRRETANLGLDKARRGNAYDEFLDPIRRKGAELGLAGAERGERQQSYSDKYYESERDMQNAGIGRKDKLSQMDLENNQYKQKYMPGMMDRANQRDVTNFDNEQYNNQYAQGAMDRSNERDVMNFDNEQYGNQYVQPGMDRAERQGIRQDQYGKAMFDDFNAGQSSQQYVQNANNAISEFEATGNTMGLEDFYNNMYDDDGTITIKKLPDGRYQGTYGDGTVSVVTKEELIQGSRDKFMKAPQANQGGGMGGYGAGMGGSRAGTSRGMPGAGISRSRGGSQGATMAKIDDLTNLYMRQGATGMEARARAYAEDSYSKRQDPQERAMDFVQEVVQEAMTSDALAYLNPDERKAKIEEIKAEAMQAAQDMFQGAGGGQQGYNGGGNQSQGGQQIPQEHLQILMQGKDDPATIQFFDEVYGPGAAEAILNGN